MIILEVDGLEHCDLLHYMNGFEPERFPPLKSRHLVDGQWWLAIDGKTAVGFAGMVPFFTMRDDIGYLKRAYVLPDYRGRGLQRRFMRLREAKARHLNYRLLVSECKDNQPSERNFLAEGYQRFDPEQPWGEPGSTYFIKRL